MGTDHAPQRQHDDAVRALRRSLEVVLAELDQLAVPADVGALIDQAIERLKQSQNPVTLD